jgi:hypothetical protein
LRSGSFSTLCFVQQGIPWSFFANAWPPQNGHWLTDDWP